MLTAIAELWVHRWEFLRKSWDNTAFTRWRSHCRVGWRERKNQFGYENCVCCRQRLSFYTGIAYCSLIAIAISLLEVNTVYQSNTSSIGLTVVVIIIETITEAGTASVDKVANQVRQVILRWLGVVTDVISTTQWELVFILDSLVECEYPLEFLIDASQ